MEDTDDVPNGFNDKAVSVSNDDKHTAWTLYQHGVDKGLRYYVGPDIKCKTLPDRYKWMVSAARKCTSWISLYDRDGCKGERAYMVHGGNVPEDWNDRALSVRRGGTKSGWTVFKHRMDGEKSYMLMGLNTDTDCITLEKSWRRAVSAARAYTSFLTLFKHPYCRGGTKEYDNGHTMTAFKRQYKEGNTDIENPGSVKVTGAEGRSWKIGTKTVKAVDGCINMYWDEVTYAKPLDPLY